MHHMRSYTGMDSSGAATTNSAGPSVTEPSRRSRHVPAGRYTVRSRAPSSSTGATR